MKLVKKITVKTCVGNIRAIAKDMADGDERVLLRVLGLVSDTKVGETEMGSYTRFIGPCQAFQVGADGEITEEFRSGAAILPDVASDSIADALAHMQAQNPDATLEFAFDIGIKADESSTVGYVYTCAPLAEMGEADPLAALRSNLPKLEHKPAETVPEKAPAKAKAAAK